MVNVELDRGHWMLVDTIEDGSAEVRRYIDEHDLGGSDWRGGTVTDIHTGEKVARISYNGRIWPAEGAR
jgi:hypothetical protein